MRPLSPAYLGKTDKGQFKPLMCPRCGRRAGHDPQSNYSYAFCLDEANCNWNSTYSA